MNPNDEAAILATIKCLANALAGVANALTAHPGSYAHTSAIEAAHCALTMAEKLSSKPERGMDFLRIEPE